MTGDDLPNEHHVVRYVNFRSIRPSNGKPAGSAFSLRDDRPDETGVSVNWLECFNNLTKAQQLDEVRRLLRLEKRKSACLAELNVGATKQHIRSELEDLRFIHKPLDATDKYPADPSHSEITGLPPGNSLSPEAEETIGDMIAACVKDMHPAVIT